MLHVPQLISGHKIDSHPLYIKVFILEAGLTALCLPPLFYTHPQENLGPHFILIELTSSQLVYFFLAAIQQYTHSKRSSDFKRENPALKDV